MPEPDDITLLRQYAGGDESAFTTLFERHVHLVYSAALRQARNPSHAEEVTQAVFILLARKAKSLSPKTVLSGWLYQAARLTTASLIKREIRRQRREQEVYMQTLTEPDTLVNAPAIQSALRSVRAGAVGGGCLPRFEGWLPWWWRLGLPVMERLCRWLNVFPSGACLFCTRGAFQTAGGFDENYYAMEDCVFVRALKRQGRFVIPAETVVTSGRKPRAYSFMSYAKLSMRVILPGSRGVRSRRGLEFWYEPEREKAE